MAHENTNGETTDESIFYGYDALDHITKLDTVNVVTGRVLSTYEYT